jgi:putative spermidine/putrescine transport system substrate-binding protein
MRLKNLAASLIVATTAASGFAGVASASGSSHTSVNYATCTDLKSCGGMSALVAAAKKEGQLNVITLPRNWANYGTLMDEFSKMYGIHITDTNPNGSSANEITAVEAPSTKQSPDAVDVGTSHATQNPGLWATYRVATWNMIPSNAKSPTGTWADDYGGIVAIGYNSAVVKTAPTSFKSLLNPMYKNQVAINGDPNQSGSGFAAVLAASLANKGTAGNITPGISYFAALKKAGNFVPVTAGPNTVQSGQTPIVVWWDYLQASEIGSVVKTWKIVIPKDAVYAGYYTQAIPKNAPDPAAARLWEEFLYSKQGQNGFLAGLTRPVELAAMIANKTVNTSLLKALPVIPKGAPKTVVASPAQQTTDASVLASKWASEVGTVK